MQLSKKSYIELFNSEMHTVQCALYPRQLQMALKNWDFPSITVTLIYEQVHQKAADCENVTYLYECFIYCYSFNYFIPGSAFTIIMLLGNLNSCTNPWIYMYFCGHIPYCTNKQLENTSAQEESVITGSIHLVDRDPEENITSA